MTSKRRLTDEQLAVVEHPAGAHARVLAVAGSGKTTTLVSRVAHLMHQRRVPPERILVLMFNKLARDEFKKKAVEMSLPAAVMRNVHTFHSFAYGLLRRIGAAPPLNNVWIDGNAVLQQTCMLAALRDLERSGALAAGEIDPEEALGAVGMWKGALIPPERAGYRGHVRMREVYATFERLRIEKQGVTFDDFVPMAVDVMRATLPGTPSRPRYSHVIVDEYQDVNLGQQIMIEILAGDQAEVMVVGDDDQTIYEWRGARPDYIRHLFPSRFPDRQTETYALTYSFRFGPFLAQCADNVIRLNQDRHPKSVVARRTMERSQVIVHEAEADVMLRQEVERLRLAYQTNGVTDLSDKIVVLGRTYAQMAGLEGEFLRHRVPYRVLGRAPFLERHEVVALCDYVRVAQAFDAPLESRIADAIRRIANVPNRRLSTSGIQGAVKQGQQRGWSPRQVFSHLCDERSSPLPRDLRDVAYDLAMNLARLAELTQRGDLRADEVLQWLVNAVDYDSHFRNFYGDGEDSFERIMTVQAFIAFAHNSSKSIVDFVDLVDRIDSTCGAPELEQIVFTTVYRTKGLEYDHVIIPSCVERMMPVHGGSESLTYDLEDAVSQPPSSSILENERRLFYVAITRARHQVLIGSVDVPRKGDVASVGAVPSRFLEEMRLVGAEVIGGGIAACDTAESVTRYVRAVRRSYEADRSLDGAVRNAVGRYLPDAGYAQAAELIVTLTEEMPPQPFAYERPYANIEARRRLRVDVARLPGLPPAADASLASE